MEQLIKKYHNLKLWQNSIPYIFQFRVLDTISSLFGEPLRDPKNFVKYAPSLLKEIQMAFDEDSEDYVRGVYPKELRQSISPVENLSMFFKILKDYPSVIKRRKEKETKLDTKYPDYFSRTFHFQTDGYTSEESAKLYDQQVEILFTGTADVMRRLLIKEAQGYILPNSKVLEIACGTGTSSRMFAQSFTSSSLTSTDISQEYIQYAKRNTRFQNVTFDSQDGTNLMYPDESFDASFSVFLHHELPNKEREESIREMLRVTKKGGVAIILDSVQIIDVPEYEEILLDFPKKYHEPFYTSYIKKPLEEIIKENGGQVLKTSRRFLSKCVVFRKHL